jgi:hypothetical protein
MKHRQGSTIGDRVAVGIALLVGMSPLLAVLVSGVQTIDRRMAPENNPEARLREITPLLCDVAAGRRPARSIVKDWLDQSPRRGYMVIESKAFDRVSNQWITQDFVVDWHGTPYFYRVADRFGRTLVDRRAVPNTAYEGNLSLQAIERLEELGRIGDAQAASVTLVSLGPDLAGGSPDDVKLTLPVNPQTVGSRP